MVTKQLQPSHAFLVLASDGVWEFLPSQSVVDMVSKFDDPQEAALSVVAESYRLWLQHETRTDDITMVVIQFQGLEETAMPISLPTPIGCVRTHEGNGAWGSAGDLRVIGGAEITWGCQRSLKFTRRQAVFLMMMLVRGGFRYTLPPPCLAQGHDGLRSAPGPRVHHEAHAHTAHARDRVALAHAPPAAHGRGRRRRCHQPRFHIPGECVVEHRRGGHG